jgi:hypothetical protein
LYIFDTLQKKTILLLLQSAKGWGQLFIPLAPAKNKDLMNTYNITIRINNGETIYLDGAPKEKYLEIIKTMTYHTLNPIDNTGRMLYSFWADENTLVNLSNVTTITFYPNVEKKQKNGSKA